MGFDGYRDEGFGDEGYGLGCRVSALGLKVQVPKGFESHDRGFLASGFLKGIRIFLVAELVTASFWVRLLGSYRAYAAT